MGDRGFLPEDVDHYVEIRGVYDGWSVAVMKDGRTLNRWPPDDRRHKPTQDYINRRTPTTGDRET